jgi:hypothetical protein
MIQRVGRMNKMKAFSMIRFQDFFGGIFPSQEAMKETGKGILRFPCKNEIKSEG